MSKHKRSPLADFEKMLEPEFEQGKIYRMHDTPNIGREALAMCHALAKRFGFSVLYPSPFQAYYRLEGEQLHVLAMAPSWEIPSEGRYFLCSEAASPEFGIGRKISLESGVKLCEWVAPPSPRILIPYCLQVREITNPAPGPESSDGQLLRLAGATDGALSLANACLNLRLKSHGYRKQMARNIIEALAGADQEAQDLIVFTLEKARSSIPLNGPNEPIGLERGPAEKGLTNEEINELLGPKNKA